MVAVCVVYIYAEVKIEIISGRKHVYIFKPRFLWKSISYYTCTNGSTKLCNRFKTQETLTERSKDFVLFRAWGFIKGWEATRLSKPRGLMKKKFWKDNKCRRGRSGRNVANPISFDIRERCCIMALVHLPQQHHHQSGGVVRTCACAYVCWDSPKIIFSVVSRMHLLAGRGWV